MATNTINGADVAIVAQESLRILKHKLLPLRAVSTNFSPDFSEKGKSVTTRVPNEVTAVDLSSGYTSQNTQTTAFQIDLDQFYGFTYGFKDLERTYSTVDLNQLFIEPAMTAVTENVFGALFGLLVDANFSASTHEVDVGGSTAFDTDSVLGIDKKLNDAKAPTPRNIVLNNSYFGSLLADGSLRYASSYGGPEAIREGEIPRLFGYGVYRYGGMPDNDQNVVGFAGARGALLMAARGVDYPDPRYGVQVENVVEPETGLPLQFRRWYDARAGELVYSVGVLYGVKAGLVDQGVKLVSA